MELNELVSQTKQINNWKSESRIIGEACEDYVKNIIKCIRCNNSNFEKYKPNEKSKDLKISRDDIDLVDVRLNCLFLWYTKTFFVTTIFLLQKIIAFTAIKSSPKEIFSGNKILF